MAAVVEVVGVAVVLQVAEVVVMAVEVAAVVAVVLQVVEVGVVVVFGVFHWRMDGCWGGGGAECSLTICLGVPGSGQRSNHGALGFEARVPS